MKYLFPLCKWWVGLSVYVLLQSCMPQLDAFSRALYEQLVDGDANGPVAPLHQAQINQFYKSRDYRPIWVNENGLLPRAGYLLKTLRAAKAEGLEVDGYSLSIIDQYLSSNMVPILARLELLLTHAFIQYAAEVRRGRLRPNPQDPNWRAIPPRWNELDLLEGLLTKKDTEFASDLRALPPPHAGYQILRTVLHQYRQLAEQGEWPKIPDGPNLRRGQRHQQVELVRQRLIMEAYPLKVSSNPTFFDRHLRYAVKQFQTRHGLKATGMVGKETRSAMNISLAQRIEQIKVNMDRWRWLPRRLGYHYIIVNTAAYELVAYVEEEASFKMRVIVGKPERPSPVLSGKIVRMVINPYWVVPRKIAVEDLVPKIIQDPDYLKTKKIRILTSLRSDAEEVDADEIDWLSIHMGNFPYTFKQEPGEKNSLGRIKFIFQNDFAVFLHDTPHPELFNQSARAFSSGCIRVEEPIKLASFLLGERSYWSREDIQAIIAKGHTESIKLYAAIPLYLVYMTVWAEPGKEVHFRKDIYQWDGFQEGCR